MIERYFKDYKASKKQKLTKLDLAILEMYFRNSSKTVYDVYVYYRARRRKSLPYFQDLLRGLVKCTPANTIAFRCLSAAVSPAGVSREQIYKHMRAVLGEVLNERTGRREINAPVAQFQDIVRRIERLARDRGKTALIYRQALPPRCAAQALEFMRDLSKTHDRTSLRALDQAIQSGDLPKLTVVEREAILAMATRLSSTAPASMRVQHKQLEESVAAVEAVLAVRDAAVTTERDE